MTKLSYKIYTLGCKVNQYDSGYLSSLLQASNFQPVNTDADIAVVNTCTVTQNSKKKGRRMFKKARSQNPRAILLVMGCWPQVYPEEVAEERPDAVFGAGEPDEVARKLAKYYQLRQPQAFADNTRVITAASERTRYFIKVQDGCEQFCSYCVVPYARGRQVSRPQKAILDELALAADQGYKEAVLSGIHLGLYGRDRHDGNDLAGLVKESVKIQGLERIRLSSIEVTEVGDELLALLKNEPKVCRHLHIPLQSGSDRMLRLMKRPYSAAFFSERIKRIKYEVPDIAVTTDVMVGFPGESEADFTQSQNLARHLRLSKLHVFPFSEHKKTPAALLSGRVDEKALKQRVREMWQLDQSLQAEYRKNFRGREIPVMVERADGHALQGRTEFYFDVSFTQADTVSPPGSEIKPGDLVRVRL